MKYNHYYPLFIIFSISLSAITCAETLINAAASAQRIILLINQDKKHQAYLSAQSDLFEFEGEPEFDYAFGLAAQATKHYHQAIFAFERVVKIQPKFLQARYALAISYFAAGNINASEYEFQQLKAMAPKDRSGLIAKYLQAINSQKNSSQGHWQHSMKLGFGVDNNANSGIDAEVVDIPHLGPIQLFDSSQVIDDYFLNTQWQSAYLKPLNLNRSWYVVGQVKHSAYQRFEEMSRTYTDVIAGWQMRDKKLKYHINSFYRPLWLDNNKYLDYMGISADISFRQQENHDLGVTGTFAMLNYQQDDLDKNQFMLGFWYQITASKLSHRLTLNLGKEEADNDIFQHLSRSFWGVSYRAVMQVSKQRNVNFQIDFTESDYDKAHPLFLTEQEDTLWKVATDYQHSINKEWSWLVKISYSQNNSSLVLYDYDRTLISTAILYQF